MARNALYLVVRLGADLYAIETAQVVEVIPLVRLKALHGAPAGVAGVMNYRGEPMPVIDLTLVATGSATAAMTATRIVIVEFGSAMARLVTAGLLVAQATETMRLDPEAFTSPGVTTDDAPYLGPVLTTCAGVVQRVTVEALLTPELLLALSSAAALA